MLLVDRELTDFSNDVSHYLPYDYKLQCWQYHQRYHKKVKDMSDAILQELSCNLKFQSCQRPQRHFCRFMLQYLYYYVKKYRVFFKFRSRRWRVASMWTHHSCKTVKRQIQTAHRWSLTRIVHSQSTLQCLLWGEI
jgi:hypothetical protein